jgi:adenylylsulfate reductase, subunit B
LKNNEQEQPRYKGGIKVNYSHCKACGRCYEVCPADVFGFDSESRLLTVDYPEDCFYCGACLLECPAKEALKMELPLASL